MYLKKGWRPTAEQKDEDYRYRPDWAAIVVSIITIVVSLVSIMVSIFARILTQGQ